MVEVVEVDMASGAERELHRYVVLISALWL